MMAKKWGGGRLPLCRLQNGRVFYLSDFYRLLKKAGLKSGDTALIHSEIFHLGTPLLAKGDYLNALSQAILEIIGKNGTLVIPTYTYSFCNNLDFNPAKSSSKMGALNEFIRKNIATHRTLDANFSHALIGKNSQKLVQANPTNSFGENGFFAKFKALNGKVLLLGSPKIGGTLFHHIEKMANVSYRPSKIKGFDGCCL